MTIERVTRTTDFHEVNLVKEDQLHRGAGWSKHSVCGRAKGATEDGGDEDNVYVCCGWGYPDKLGEDEVCVW